MNVYCEDCKFFYQEFPMPRNDFKQFWCSAPDWHGKVGRIYALTKNANNDCTDFTKKDQSLGLCSEPEKFKK
jgi:hypothetical protein